MPETCFLRLASSLLLFILLISHIPWPAPLLRMNHPQLDCAAGKRKRRAVTGTQVFENFLVETSTTGLHAKHRNCGNCAWVAERVQTHGGLPHLVRAVLGFLVVEHLCLPLTLMFNDSHQAALLSALSALHRPQGGPPGLPLKA